MHLLRLLPAEVGLVEAVLPRVVDERGPFDFSRCDKLVDAGYRAASEFLAERSELPQAGALP